jgi:hypothetical protein
LLPRRRKDELRHQADLEWLQGIFDRAALDIPNV